MADDDDLRCTTPHCPGDPVWASPGHGHLDVCQYPLPYDGDEVDPQAEAMAKGMAPFLTLILLFGAATQGANRNEKRALYEARLLLQKRTPLDQVAQAIFDARGPEWRVPSETLQAIERLHQKG